MFVGLSKDRKHLSLLVSSYEEDNTLLLQMFPRQTYNLTPDVVLTFPVSTVTDMAVALLLLGHAPSRHFFKCWVIVEARAVGHSLDLDIKYLSRNGSQVNEPTITLELDKMQMQQEVTIYVQSSKRALTISLDCRELASKEIHLRRPNVKRYFAMQLLEVSEQVLQTVCLQLLND